MDNRLRELREAARLSQSECAQRVGVTRQTVISIERGHFDPRLSLAFRLSDLFGVPVDDLFSPAIRPAGENRVTHQVLGPGSDVPEPPVLD